VKDFAATHSEILDANVYVSNEVMYLKKKEGDEEVKLMSGPRVGLTLKKLTPTKVKYLYADYRFIDSKYAHCISKA
jgi:hypothetical protein